MKLQIELGGRMLSLEFERDGRRLTGTLDGKAFEADAVEVGSGIYSILIAGSALEAQVEPAPTGFTVLIRGNHIPVRVADPRQWQGRRGHAVEAEGPQQILAPMPGKVVRILVKQGDRVDAGRGILVVEAMKMQNEIRSPKTGTVERLLVTEGQAVNAGEAVAVIG